MQKRDSASKCDAKPLLKSVILFSFKAYSVVKSYVSPRETFFSEGYGVMFK